MSQLHTVSVKDEIAKLNAALMQRSPAPINRIPRPPSIAKPAEPQLSEPEPETRSRSGSTCSRAKKTDIYTIAQETIVLRIIAEIDAGLLVSNTSCAPWTKGSKHHPCHPDTEEVRRHLSMVGPQTREQIARGLPDMGEKLIRSILHELKEQDIVKVSS